MRASPILLLAFALSGCATYALSTAPGPAKEMPEALYGAAIGRMSRQSLAQAGWALADESGERQTWILGAPEQGVVEVEANARAGAEGQITVELVRVKYASPRLATYRALLESLVGRHGPPQESAELPSTPLLAFDAASDRPRPSRVVVHRWRGTGADLVLAGGLEATENLKTGMEYQLVLVPAATHASAR